MMRKCVLLLGKEIRKNHCFKDLKVRAELGEASKNIETWRKNDLKIFKSCFLNMQNNQWYRPLSRCKCTCTNVNAGFQYVYGSRSFKKTTPNSGPTEINGKTPASFILFIHLL